jgi:hypothetical protein
MVHLLVSAARALRCPFEFGVPSAFLGLWGGMEWPQAWVFGIREETLVCAVGCPELWRRRSPLSWTFRRRPGRGTATFSDVGQDSPLVEFTNGRRMLIDGGGWRPGEPDCTTRALFDRGERSKRLPLSWNPLLDAVVSLTLTTTTRRAVRCAGQLPRGRVVAGEESNDPGIPGALGNGTKLRGVPFAGCLRPTDRRGRLLRLRVGG